MNTLSLFLTLSIGGVMGAIIAGLLMSNKLERLSVTIRQLQRKLDDTPDLPLGAIQSAVADCSNQPVHIVALVLEAIRMKPSWCRALTAYPTTPENCADEHAARTYADHPLLRARILRKESVHAKAIRRQRDRSSRT
jgi:hypothetical protein